MMFLIFIILYVYFVAGHLRKLLNRRTDLWQFLIISLTGSNNL